MKANTDADLYFQTVPMFLAFAPRIVHMVEVVNYDPSILSRRLADDCFSAGEQFMIAQGFILRTIFPLMGRDCPELSTDEPTLEGVSKRHAQLISIVRGIELSDFEGAAARQISHVAGDAQLVQSAPDYVQLYGIPNFIFHMTMGYATLRANGIELGKVHFDGLHSYSTGFSFQD